MIKKDFIIVGQGLAGTLLSYQLLKRKKSVMVINQSIPDTSSKVAAGIYNPITGKRMVKTWKADLLFSYLEPFYHGLQSELRASFLFPKQIYRPFISIEEQNETMGKTASGDLNDFISWISINSKYGNLIHDELGGFAIKSSGFVDLTKLIHYYQKYLVSRKSYLEDKFYEEDLIVFDNYLQYKNIVADRLVYCDGIESRNGRYFNWLPYNLVKGEIILIKANIRFDSILSRGIFILPIGEGYYKVGSTYNWSDLNKDPTENARNELLEKLKNLVKFPYEVVDQFAGIRPATKDRRPFIGIHPKVKTIAIFNGLGTKGVSLAPYFSGEFADYLVLQKELDKDVNINRYNSLYYN
ncbi:FAD-dependent oxidoreductase [soil metagenome]